MEPSDKLSLHFAAKAFGIGRETLGRALTKAGITGDDITILNCHRALSGDADLASARARDLNAAAELKELKVQKQRGDLIPLDDVRKHIAAALGPLRQRMLSLPSLAARVNQSDPETARAVLGAWVDETLSAMKGNIEEH